MRRLQLQSVLLEISYHLINQLDTLYHWLHLVLFYQYINTLITRSSLCTSVYISTFVKQYMSTWVHKSTSVQHSTSAHQHISTSVHQYISTSVQQYISTSAHQYITVITQSSLCTQHTHFWRPPPRPAWLSRPQWTSPRWWPWCIDFVIDIFLLLFDYLMLQTLWECRVPRTAGSGSWWLGRGRAGPDLG